MVEVYLWRPNRANALELAQFVTGHVSLKVGDSYLSFWPSISKFGKANSGLVNPDVPDFSVSSYEEDISKKRMNEQAGFLLAIHGLNEYAMLHDWEVIKRSPIRYSIPISTCASVTNCILRAGFVFSDVGKVTRPDSRHVGLHAEILAANSPISHALIPPIPLNTFKFAMLIKNVVEQHNSSEEEVFRRSRALTNESLWEKLGLPRARNERRPIANAIYDHS